MNQEITAEFPSKPSVPIAGYVTCKQCGAILGYKSIVCGELYLYTFSYPVQGVRPGLADRRVNGRILAGDVHCPFCGNWQGWSSRRRSRD
jgi:ribosomal protein S27E